MIRLIDKGDFIMNKIYLIAGIFLGIGLVSGFSVATLVFHPHPPRWEHKMHLTSEDKQKIHELFKQDHESVHPLLEQMEKSQHELKQVLSDNTASDSIIREKFKAFQSAREALTNRRFELNLKIRDIVGPERMNMFDVLGPQPPHQMGPPPGPHGPHEMEPGAGGPPNMPGDAHVGLGSEHI